ncbi:MAG TPA: DUF433 domain-containing protein [Candidatus Brocadiales bacterium]|nr:DUF433 domain-containing protein [Candidatus Brocadiales bacterium]
MSAERTSSIRHLKHPYISIDPKVSKGSPVISGTRVRVVDIAIEYDRLGLTPDQIIDAHPHLNLEAVHDALSYYYENRESMDEEIRRKKEIIRGIAKKSPSILKKAIG